MKHCAEALFEKASAMIRIANLDSDVKHTIDVLSIGTWLTALLGIIPSLTTLAAFLWMCIRIYDGWLSVKLKHKELAKHDQQPKD